MQNFHSMTVREIALEMPVTTRVFEEFKIDYCCRGNTRFDEACLKVGADPETVLQKIDGVLDAVGNRVDEAFTEMRLDDLIDHILDKHHVFTRSEIGSLVPLMAKVAGRHGDQNPYLFELQELFQSVCDDLEPHMMKEEMVLFPYIQQLVYSFANGISTAFPPFGTVQHPINMMNIEHEVVGELLAKMRAVTNDYALPDGACPSFTALYHRLAEFERDLHQHIHLENNILFPRAIELEQMTIA